MKMFLTRHGWSREALVASVATLTLAVPAIAQQQQSGDSQQLERAEPGQLPQAPRAPQPPGQQLDPSYWGLSSGFEADAHATGYGFLGPIYHKSLRRNLQLVVGANVNYLSYEFESSEGRTNVRSPGVSTKAGVRMGDRNWLQLTAGPSFKRKHRELRSANDNIHGA